MTVSRGESKTRCSARESSTTPRLGPRWPPVLVTLSMRKSRISRARRTSSSRPSRSRSRGPCTVLRTDPTLDADAALADPVFDDADFDDAVFADAVLVSEAVSALELPGSDTGPPWWLDGSPSVGEARSSSSPVPISRARAPKIRWDEGPSLIAERSSARVDHPALHTI